MTNETHTAGKDALQTPLQTLRQQLQQSLVPLDSEADPTDILRQQMRVLHHICNRMLADADGKYDQLVQYNLALRAQNQYRQTLLALEALESQGRKDL